MAISRLQPLLLLFSSIFFLQAFRPISAWEYCAEHVPSRITITDVKFSATDPGAILVYGHTGTTTRARIEVTCVTGEPTKTYRVGFTSTGLWFQSGEEFVIPLTLLRNFVEGATRYMYVIRIFPVGEYTVCIKFNFPTFAPELVSV